MSMAAVIKSVQDRCIAEKGHYIPYSQCVEPTKALIESMPATNEGICQALSAKWIAEHANGGSLFNWLCVPGTTTVKPSSIANLMINFTESVTQSGGLANQTRGIQKTAKKSNLYYQDFITERYLRLYGLRLRGGLRGDLVGAVDNQIGGGKSGFELASRLQPSWLRSKGEVYVLISIMGNGGHAMAAYCAGEEAILFDPNYGEYYFPKYLNFYNWFTYFYVRVGYAKAFKNFYLLTFAKDATGNWSKYK